MVEPLIIGGKEIKAGEECRIDLPTAPLYADTQIAIPVYVKRGKKPGPTLFVSAAIHGDELNGIEIASRLIHSKATRTLKGTLIVVPIVNSYGVLAQSRYLPDRRDLNRSFPGSKRGTLAGRLAHLFLTEIVSKCDYGIDLHTGAIHRSNYPQIRANLDDEETLSIAKSFGVPVLLNAQLRDGSLRASAADLGIKILLYEAGQALRFDELSIRAGYKGVINVLRELGMLNKVRAKKKPMELFVARDSTWVRASESGFVVHLSELGAFVTKGQKLAVIKSTYGDILTEVKATTEGVIIGKQNIPLVQEGEAMYHIATFKKSDDIVENIATLEEELVPEGM